MSIGDMFYRNGALRAKVSCKLGALCSVESIQTSGAPIRSGEMPSRSTRKRTLTQAYQQARALALCSGCKPREVDRSAVRVDFT